MLKDEKVKEVIRSREDLSTCENNGLNYRIMKKATGAGVKFMKLLIRACMQSGPLLSS
jgi:hypothetical protein